MNQQPYQIEMNLMEIIDILMDNKKLNKETLEQIQYRLHTLEAIYNEQIRNISIDQFEVDRKLNKSRWNKTDKALLPLTFGIGYPWLRKIHQEEKHFLMRDRSSLIEDKYHLENTFLPKIRKYLDFVNERLITN